MLLSITSTAALDIWSSNFAIFVVNLHPGAKRIHKAASYGRSKNLFLKVDFRENGTGAKQAAFETSCGQTVSLFSDSTQRDHWSEPFRTMYRHAVVWTMTSFSVGDVDHSRRASDLGGTISRRKTSNSDRPVVRCWPMFWKKMRLFAARGFESGLTSSKHGKNLDGQNLYKNHCSVFAISPMFHRNTQREGERESYICNCNKQPK